MPLEIIFTYESFLLQCLSSKSKWYLKYLKSDKFCWYLVNKGQGLGAGFFFFFFPSAHFLNSDIWLPHLKVHLGKKAFCTAFLVSCQPPVQKEFSTYSQVHSFPSWVDMFSLPPTCGDLLGTSSTEQWLKALASKLECLGTSWSHQLWPFSKSQSLTGLQFP